MTRATHYGFINTILHDVDSGIEYLPNDPVLTKRDSTIDISEISTILVVSQRPDGITCNALDKDFKFKTTKNYQYLYISLPATLFTEQKKPRFDIHSFFTEGQHQPHVARIEYFDHANDSWTVHRPTGNPLTEKVSLIRIVFAMRGDRITAPFSFDVFVRDRTPGGGVGIIDCDPQAGNEPPVPGASGTI